MDWLDGISITCFAASYLVALGLVVSRIFFRTSLRKYLVIGIMVAGLFAHTVYLMRHAGMEFSSGGVWTGNWSAWTLAAAWCVATACLWIVIRQPQSVVGLFLLPLVLLLVGIGTFLPGESFSASDSRSVWSMVHGLCLLLGTAAVVFGFAAGVMYLMQASRLKRKVGRSEWFRLPSLEWLQNASEKALVVSVALLGMGLASGLFINLAGNRIATETDPNAVRVVAWSDPVVWTSGVLFLWLVAAMLFNRLYQPARQGRKVAYLVVASFLFLMLELGIVLWSGHGATPDVSQNTEPVARCELPSDQIHQETV
ncbi:MAG: cytochrome c biogenesis protein CcsA [Planctomycetota bacterium]